MDQVIVPLEAGLKASLDWSSAKEQARSAAAAGAKILWDLQLGLFSELHYPFSHQSQFLSLRLSIDHFKEQVWPHFDENSIGVILYRGPADYRSVFPWDDAQRENLREWLKAALADEGEFQAETGISLTTFDEVTPALLERTPGGTRLLSLFCRDASVEYLNLLAANIPDEIPLFVELDTSSIQSGALKVQLAAAEKYERLQIGLPKADEEPPSPVGICLPPAAYVRAGAVDGLEEALQALAAEQIAYRVIPEELLITEWDGLDALIVLPQAIGSQGRRKLQGFCAAGGLVVSLGEALHLPNEQQFHEWIQQKPVK